MQIMDNNGKIEWKMQRIFIHTSHRNPNQNADMNCSRFNIVWMYYDGHRDNTDAGGERKNKIAFKYL